MKIIKYQIMTEVNIGTEEEPNIVTSFNDKTVECSDESFEKMYAIAKAEAYNGEVTVEEVKDEVSEPTADDVLNAMLGVRE